VRRVCVLLIRAYRLSLGAVLTPSCRFAPSCSRYAEQAIEHHGLGRGGALACRRIVRCHPWSHGGWDPVPSAE